ncbi:hypothetical protein E3983_11145 [Legionella israelensis]|uniref:Uncharacterized protein n=1 Tax=Legionella israelensis TaxID=454 RepID=A0A0W0WIJ5_9GAMM|nr:hypothetical protein [Legionella israelensis]KTD32146.1 hypothetical protein Lisr_0469 [Legionella israelensis]QBR84858.1 hypothetical protein E3983_11145 [Legionella israelensis]QBS10263.1 hypothetical protein E4T55_10575 [Legionella israelensis]QDP73337.1 hypothetical protein FOG18_12570 [Legionella israelensis]STX59860.1 Uncharacterised protein [Legionella israelensis]
MPSFYKPLPEGIKIELYIKVLSSLKEIPTAQARQSNIQSLVSELKDIRKYSDVADLISNLQWRDEKSPSYPKAEELDRKTNHREAFKAAQERVADMIENILGKQNAKLIFDSFHQAGTEYTGNKKAYMETIMQAMEEIITKDSNLVI